MRALSLLGLLLALGLASTVVLPWHAGASPDPQNDAVIAEIEVGPFPRSVAVNPLTNRIYVPSFVPAEVTPNPTQVSVFDGASNTLIATVPIDTDPIGWGPETVEVNPVTNRVYAVDTAGMVWVIDGSTNDVVSTIDLAPEFKLFPADRHLAINPITNRIYVSDFANGKVSVLDGTTDTIIHEIVFDQAHGIAVNPATNRIFVSNITHEDPNTIIGSVEVMAGDPEIVIASILTEPTWDTLHDTPFDIAVNTTTDIIYVTTEQGVLVIDGATNETITALDLGYRCELRCNHIAVNETTDRVYVAGAGTISVIDGTENAIIARRSIHGATGMTVNPTTDRIYVSGGSEVVVLDGAKLEEAQAESAETVGGAFPPTGSAPGPGGPWQPLLLVVSGAAALALSTLGVWAALRKTAR